VKPSPVSLPRQRETTASLGPAKERECRMSVVPPPVRLLRRHYASAYAHVKTLQ
jgi:hypothetical protein